MPSLFTLAAATFTSAKRCADHPLLWLTSLKVRLIRFSVTV
jgi:hypothetical protein